MIIPGMCLLSTLVLVLDIGRSDNMHDVFIVHLQLKYNKIILVKLTIPFFTV